MKEKEYNQRTLQQNRALHLYFQLVADELNSAGMDMRKVLKPSVEIPWSKDTVKEYLWRPIMKLQLMKKSTIQMTTKDIDKIYDTLNRFLGQQGLHVEFPSIEAIIDKQIEAYANAQTNKKKNIR